MSDASEIRAKLRDRRVVLSVSGGKDSAAASLYLHELGIEHDRVFADTGWEHPDTYAYLRGPLMKAIGPIIEVKGKRGGMVDLIRHKGMFPSRVRRFCTQELKVFPIKAHIAALMESGTDVVNAVGIRAEESAARAKHTEWEWQDGFDCEAWRPILHWTFEDVVAIHHRHGLAPNPLYLKGASRVGCWPCIYARKEEVRLVADLDPERIDTIRSLEEELTEAAKSRGSDDRRTFFGPWLHGEGARACRTIDAVVRWSRTASGGKNLALFASGPPDEGCMRWGLCDTGASP